MKLHLTYLSLQLKKLFQFFPKLIAGTIVLAVLAGAIAFYGASFLYQDTVAEHISIALVVEDDSTLMDLALTYLKSSESVNSFCTLIETSDTKARQMLQTNRVSAVIHFPKHFSRDVISGKNTPATITFSEETGIEQLLFQELTAAASRILTYAQASIYSLGDLYEQYDFYHNRSTHYDYINQNTMETALLRSSLFRTETISATERTSLKDFYTTTGILLLLFLSGMSFARFAQPEKASLAKLLSLRGLSPLARTFWKLCSLVCFYLILGGLILLAVCLLGLGTWKLFFLLPLLALSVSTQTLFLFRLTSSQTTGTLLIFIFTFLCSFCSGTLIPSAFLPESILFAGRLFPMGYLHRLLCICYTSVPAWTDYIPVLAFILLYFVLTVLHKEKGEIRHEF